MVAALFAIPGAYAAGPNDIASDLADGRLDGTYSQAELSTYLQNATLQGYGNPVPPVVTPVTPVTPVGSAPAVTPVAAPASGVAGVQTPAASPKPAAAVQPAAASPATGVKGAQSPPLAATRSAGTLPFTGIDLALLTIGGLLMLMLGFGARRFGRNH